MRKLLLFGIATLLVACDYNNDAELKTTPIDSKIIIETKEVLEPGARRLTFQCKTEKTYPCINFPLLTEEKIDESSFKITFTSVGETALCFTALGPATTAVDLNALSNGEYEIEFNNADLGNKGTLIVTNTDIKLFFDQENGIEIVRPVTMRVPENTYWGIIGYNTQSLSTLAEEFIQILKDEGAVFNKQVPGHYFYYEIDGSGEIVANGENSGRNFIRPFIFQYTGDESQLEDLIRIEGGDLSNDLSIRLHTFEGEDVYN